MLCRSTITTGYCSFSCQTVSSVENLKDNCVIGNLVRRTEGPYRKTSIRLGEGGNPLFQEERSQGYNMV